MKRLCPSSCDFCYGEAGEAGSPVPARVWRGDGALMWPSLPDSGAEFPFPTVAATAPPPRTKTRLVPEGRNVTFRCGQKILHKKGKV